MESDNAVDQSLASTNFLAVEVAYATPQRQMLVKLHVPAGTTVEQAIEASGLREHFPAIEQRPIVGIFSRKAGLQDHLKAGDRVEIYRPLLADPKEARREKASIEKKDGTDGSRQKGVRPKRH